MGRVDGRYEWGGCKVWSVLRMDSERRGWDGWVSEGIDKRVDEGKDRCSP